MKVLVLYNNPEDDAAVDEQDVLAQRDTVLAALSKSGYQTQSFGCTLDLDAVRRHVQEFAPDVVFNLVESLGGTDRLMPLATLLLDALNVRYTGAHSGSILATSDKLTAKQRFSSAELPTPAWVVPGNAIDHGLVDPADIQQNQWILKPVWEHASFSMDDDAVVSVEDAAHLESRLIAREKQFGRPFFAEQFIAGREFNVSLLAGEVLPLAEIDFSSFPPAKPRIVGHQAKWDAESFEYQQTPRRFDFAATDAPLRKRVSEIARDCWKLFEMRGYARVDFRVDNSGQPWILEVNANPCLSLDAGFSAALAQAGIRYDEAIQRIIDAS